VAKYASNVCSLAIRHVKPGYIAGRRSAESFFYGEIDAAVGAAEAHACQCVDDAAQAVIACQLV